MLTIAAHPKTVLDHPAVDVIKSIKPVWDETIVLPDSRIGELSIFARRSGEMWLLAIMAGATPRELSLPLTFLGEGQYVASYVRDDEAKPDAVKIDQSRAQRTDRLSIRLNAGG
jgi:alpha-glucosidase